MMGEKWIIHASLLAKVLNISIEYCEEYKFQEESGPWVPWSQGLGPRFLFLPTPMGVHGTITCKQAQPIWNVLTKHYITSLHAMG